MYDGSRYAMPALTKTSPCAVSSESASSIGVHGHSTSSIGVERVPVTVPPSEAERTFGAISCHSCCSVATRSYGRRLAGSPLARGSSGASPAAARRIASAGGTPSLSARKNAIGGSQSAGMAKPMLGSSGGSAREMASRCARTYREPRSSRQAGGVR